MPYFHNPHPHPITMQFGNNRPVVVPPNKTVEVAARWAPYVVSRGYRVVEVPGPATAAAAADEPTPETQPGDAQQSVVSGLLARIAAAASVDELGALRDEYERVAPTLGADECRAIATAGEARYHQLVPAPVAEPAPAPAGEPQAPQADEPPTTAAQPADEPQADAAAPAGDDTATPAPAAGDEPPKARTRTRTSK